jgi:hypothetical protein
MLREQKKEKSSEIKPLQPDLEKGDFDVLMYKMEMKMGDYESGELIVVELFGDKQKLETSKSNPEE